MFDKVVVCISLTEVTMTLYDGLTHTFVRCKIHSTYTASVPTRIKADKSL